MTLDDIHSKDLLVDLKGKKQQLDDNIISKKQHIQELRSNLQVLQKEIIRSMKEIRNETDLKTKELLDTNKELSQLVIDENGLLEKIQHGQKSRSSQEKELEEFKIMVEKIRITEKMLGNKNFQLRNKIKRKRKIYLRYLTAKKEIKKGDTFSLNNIGFYRHNKSRPGLDPKYFFRLDNKKSKINIRKGQIFNKKHLQ